MNYEIDAGQVNKENSICKSWQATEDQEKEFSVFSTGSGYTESLVRNINVND